MVSGEYPPRWGGMGSVVYHLAGHMAQRGHKVTVITRKHKQMAPTQTGVEVIPVRWAPVPMSFTKSFGKHAIKAIKQSSNQSTNQIKNDSTTQLANHSNESINPSICQCIHP